MIRIMSAEQSLTTPVLRQTIKPFPIGVGLLVLSLAASMFSMSGLAAPVDGPVGILGPRSSAPDPLASSHHCSHFPTGVVRTDYFLDIVSTLPHYYGLPAQLDIHRVSPVYRHGRCPDSPIQVAILVHGSTIDAVTDFDLQYDRYSLMESLAWAGVETFSVNLLGWGLSTRFGLDDPCNASVEDQRAFLIPNPLSETCANPDPFHFTTSAAMWDQLDAVVTDVQARVGVDKVSLLGWSGGGHVVGGYTDQNPSKVKNLVVLASAYNFPSDPPDPLPQPGVSLGLRDRTAALNAWSQDVDDVACPGQQDPDILDPVWEPIRARDPLGSTWGSTDPRTGGMQRFPTQDRWGWNDERAAHVTVPTLVLSGLRDTIVPTANMTQLYNALGSPRKVFIKIACASHYVPWEGSTSPTWEGPHATLQDAAVQWITTESYQEVSRGTFQVNADGSIDGPF